MAELDNNVTPITNDTTATGIGDGSGNLDQAMAALSGSPSASPSPAGNDAPPSLSGAPADNSTLSNITNAPTTSMPVFDTSKSNGFVQGDRVATKPVSKWERILTGALVGLSGGAGTDSFGAGLSGGAKAYIGYNQQKTENDQRQQELDMRQKMNESTIKFQSAQAAALAAETAIRDKQLHQMDEDHQMTVINNGLEQMKTMQGMGLQPTLVVANTNGGAEAKAGLQQLTDSHGGVPPMFTINLGNKIVGFDLNQLTQAPQTLEQVNKIRSLQGQQPYDSQTWAQMPQQLKNQVTDSAFNFFNPMPNEQNLMQYKNYLATVQAQPDSPEKAANVAKLQGIVTGMQKGLDAANKREISQAASKAGAVASATMGAQQRFMDANTPPTAVDPNSQSILAQTGLSMPAFFALTGNMSQLPRDKASRAKAMKEAQDWANKKGVDISTLASQYKTYNEVLSNNISRLNNTKIMEQELEGTIQNLSGVADAKEFGNLRVKNVSKLWAGKEVNDELTQRYAMHLNQLRTELAAYNAATQGRTGNNITDSDKKEAERVINNGIASGSLKGLEQAVKDSTGKMDTVMQSSVERARKNVWGLFGVDGNFKGNNQNNGNTSNGNTKQNGGGGWGGQFGGVKH